MQKKKKNAITTFVIKQTFYLQKVEAPKVTFGILFWILNEHSVQVWEKIKVKKKKELCLSFLKVKTLSAMRFFFFFFFFSQKGYADAEIPPNFFFIAFFGNYFFFRGRSAAVF